MLLPDIKMFWNGEAYMIGFLIAIISGALMSIQGVWNTEVTKQTSLWLAAGFVQFTALLVCVVAWFITGKESSLGALFSVSPKYLLLGGAIGAFITYTVIQSVAMLGPARANMIIVTAQLVVAYIIEVFGLFGSEKTAFSWQKLFAVAVIVAGIVWFNGVSKN